MEQQTTCRAGHWIQPMSGVRFWPLDPRAEEVRITDIARALSNICRYGGHLPRFYSVAQHSVIVSQYVIRHLGKLNVTAKIEASLWGLLHDAGEAYVGDVIWPIKAFGGVADRMIEAEERVMRCVCEAFMMHPDMPTIVKTADSSVLLAEARDFLGREIMEVMNERIGGPGIEPWPEARIEPSMPEAAEALFIERWTQLEAARHSR